MNWRPEGWQTLKAKNYPLHCFTPDDCVGMAFEAGADAILEALKQTGTPTGLKYTAYANDRKGWLVFIPDKEAE